MPNPQQKPKLLGGKTGGIKHKWWLVGGVGVGALAFMYYRNATAKTPVDPSTGADVVDDSAYDSTSDPYAGYDDMYGSGVGGAYGSFDGTVSPASDPTFAQAAAVQANAAVDSAVALGNLAGSFSDIADNAARQPQTNKEWMHEAIHALMNHGYTHAEAVASVSGYVAGAPLTKKQTHAVESALGSVGAPPNPVPRLHQVPVPKQTKKDAREPAHKKAEKVAKNADPPKQQQQSQPQQKAAPPKPPPKPAPKPAPVPSGGTSKVRTLLKLHP